MYEKKLVILIGALESKGTLKLERSSLGLCATLFASKVEEADYMLAVLDGGARYDYPIGLLPSEAVLSIDESIRIDRAHFVVYKRYGDAVLYGTLASERMWWGNLPNGRKDFEKKIASKDSETELAPSFEFSESVALACGQSEKVSPLYDDEQIATENYYEEENASVEVEEVDLTKRPSELNEPIINEPSIEEEPLKEEATLFVGRKADYYEQVKESVEKLFEGRERVIELEKQLPFSKWVKVEYDGARHYLVGVVGSPPDYICYGLPSVYSHGGPPRIEEEGIFLPKSPRFPHGEGYWLLYQDAKTGKTVKK